MILKQGWINLYKPKNITSFKAIKSIKKNFSIDKIGHAGTLDPMAEGVLPIAIGKATKLISYISNINKEYEFNCQNIQEFVNKLSETLIAHEELLEGGSVGKFINQSIKSGVLVENK